MQHKRTDKQNYIDRRSIKRQDPQDPERQEDVGKNENADGFCERIATIRSLRKEPCGNRLKNDAENENEEIPRNCVDDPIHSNI